MSKIVIRMEQDKVTKNKIRYASPVEGEPADNIYVLKSAFEGTPPQFIEVEIRTG